MTPEEAKEIADRFEKQGNTKEANRIRQRYGVIPAASPVAPTPKPASPQPEPPAALPAPRVEAPVVAPAPRAPRAAAPLPSPDPAPARTDESLEEEQQRGVREYEERAIDDFIAGRLSEEEMDRINGYTLTEETKSALREMRARRAPAATPTAATPTRGMDVVLPPAREPIRLPIGSDTARIKDGRVELDVTAPGEMIFDEGDPVYGRVVDEPQASSLMRTRLNKMQTDLEREYIERYGYTVEAAQEKARRATEEVLLKRVDTSGQPTTRGEGGLGSLLPIVPPFFRESRIDFRRDPDVYREPGEMDRPPTSFEKVVETFARQEVVTPQMAMRARQVRALERQAEFEGLDASLMFNDEYADQARQEIAVRTDPFFRNILSEVDPGTGVGIETPLGAVIRQTGIISTIANEAFLGLPLFYDVDEQGDPVDTNQFAFKVNDFLTSSLERMGVSREDAEDLTSGVIGGETVPTGIPVPFQAIARKSPTVIDPIGMRAASETETFLGDVTTSLAKGRFLGDELYSMPSYFEELATGAFYNNDDTFGTGARLIPEAIDSNRINQAALFYPMAIGAGAEMVYGIGPISALGKIGRVTGKAAKAASLAGAAKAGAKAAEAAAAGAPLAAARFVRAEDIFKDLSVASTFVSNPVEQSKKVKLIRAGQDLLADAEGEKPLLDLFMDQAEIKRVIATKAAEDVLTPYLLVDAFTEGAINQSGTVGDLRKIAGQSSAGREFLRKLGIVVSDPDDKLISELRDLRAEAMLEYKVSINKPVIDSIMANKELADAEKAARIYDLLAGEAVDALTGLTPEQRSARLAKWRGPDGKWIRESSKTPPPPDATFFSRAPARLLTDLHRVSAQTLNKAGQARKGDLLLADVMKALPQQNRKYLPVSSRAPIMQSMHKFGEDLMEERPLRGPLAEGYSRRLVEGGRGVPEFRAQAAIGSGARAVEATLENLIPEDLVLVTDSLMVPRQGLSREVLSEVRTRFEANAFDPEFPLFEAKKGPKVNDVDQIVYEWNIDDGKLYEVLGGRNAIERSPIRQSILQRFAEADQGVVPQLTANEHHFLSDALLARAYRDVLGPRQALDAVFAGDQTTRAAVPSATLGIISDVQARLPGVGAGELAPAQSRSLAEAREPSLFSLPSQALAVTRNMLGSAVLKASKKYPTIDYTPFRTDFKGQTPFSMQGLSTRIQEQVSAIPDNFQREVRNELLKTPDPEAAFNKVLQRRIAAEVVDGEEMLNRRVQGLLDMGVTEESAWSTVAYQQRAGEAVGGLGEQAEFGGIIAGAKAEALKLLREQVTRKAWGSMIQTFFGEDIYNNLISVGDLGLDRYIKTRVPAASDEVAELLPISLSNFRLALERIRTDNPQLAIRGLQRPNVPMGEFVAGIFTYMERPSRDVTVGNKTLRLINDAVLDVSAAWAMGSDRTRVVAREATLAMDANPWMRTDLSPSSYSAAASPRSGKPVGADPMLDTQVAAREARAQVFNDLIVAADRRALKSEPKPTWEKIIYKPFKNKKRQGPVSRAKTVKAPKDLDRPVRTGDAAAQQQRTQYPFNPDFMEGSPIFDTQVRPGRHSTRLNNLTKQAYKNLNPKIKRELVNYIYGKMLEQGRQTPDLRVEMYDALDNPQLNTIFFEKRATSVTIDLILEGMDGDVARAGGDAAFAFRATKDDFDLYTLIQKARSQNMTNQEIKEIIRRALLKNALQSFVEPVISEMQANAKAYGWLPDMAESRRNITPAIEGLNIDDPRFALAGQGYLDALSNLKVASKDGKLAENLDALQRSEKLQKALAGDVKSSGDYAIQVLLDILATPRSLAASGLLGGGFYVFNTDDWTGGRADTPFPTTIPGIPLPNTRYIGTNFITAPLIAAMTIGTVGAIRMMPGTVGLTDQARQVGLQAASQGLPERLKRPLVNTIGMSPNNPEEVLFTTRTGKPVTRMELANLMEEHNISITRGGVEFANAFARDLARDARLTAEGLPAGKLRQYLLRNMDPTRTGFWQYAANATDRMFRQNVFASALQDGMTPAQSAQLARNVVLDYGNVKYSSGLNRYVMFLAFRESMAREFVESLARDPDTINRTILNHRNLQKQMDEELNADHARFRLPMGGATIFDSTAAAKNWGPVNPGLSMYADLVKFASMGLQAGARDIPAGALAQAVSDESLSPIIDVLMSDALARPTTTGRGQKVDDIWVAYAIQNSPDRLWPWMKERYHIVPVLRGEERKAGRLEAVDPEAEALGRVEFRFETPQDHANFIRDMAILQVLGFRRTMEDYTKMGLTYGVEDAIDPKRRGLPSTFGFATGLETPLSMQSEMAIIQRALRQQEAAIRGKTPRE